MAKRTSVKAFWCQHQDGYSVVSFPREMATAHMADIRDAGGKILEHLQAVKSPACVVDLSALDYMGSSLVATIVRIWKAVREKQGQMVVVTSNERIFEVLKATGLAKVWTIEPTFESGVHALGFSPEAKVEKRENRLLKFVGPLSVVGGGLLVAARMIPQIRVPVPIPDWVVYTALGLSLLASGITMVREKGIQRVLCTLGFLVTLPLLGFFVWYTEIRLPDPHELPPGPQVSSGDASSSSSATSAEQSDSANMRESGISEDADLLGHTSSESAAASSGTESESAKAEAALPEPETAPANSSRTVGEKSLDSGTEADSKAPASQDKSESSDKTESSGAAEPADLPVPTDDPKPSDDAELSVDPPAVDPPAVDPPSVEESASSGDQKI